MITSWLETWRKEKNGGGSNWPNSYLVESVFTWVGVFIIGVSLFWCYLVVVYFGVFNCYFMWVGVLIIGVLMFFVIDLVVAYFSVYFAWVGVFMIGISLFWYYLVAVYFRVFNCLFYMSWCFNNWHFYVLVLSIWCLFISVFLTSDFWSWRFFDSVFVWKMFD